MTGTRIVDGLIASIGPYQVEQLIGRGGMGEVYRAFDTRRNRAVALKVLPPETALDEHYRARFRRESDSAARLQDPHVIPIHDFGEIDGRLYIDMRLVDGAGLDRLLAEGPLDPRRAVAIVGQVAEALTDAHAHGVVHRDVKPSNILVTRSDFVYLVDFGIARSSDGAAALTSTGEAIGTLAYMAPERFDGGSPDSRSDIYALACILAECLLGRHPFPGTSLPTLMKAHLLADPPRPSLVRPDVPPALDEVIRRGMAKDPQHRFQTAAEFARAAHAALAAAPVVPAQRQVLAMPAVSRPLSHVAAAPPRRTFGVPALIACALVIGVVLGAVGFLVGRTTAPAVASSTVAAAPTTPPRAALPTTRPQIGAPASPSTPPARYTFTVDSNYPVFLSYIDSAGDQVSEQSVPAPWTREITTSAWGADAHPFLSATAQSTKGDTTVTCTILDDEGHVVATDTRASANASVSCYSVG